MRGRRQRRTPSARRPPPPSAASSSLPRLRTDRSPVREELKPPLAQESQTRAFRKRLHLTAGMRQLFQKSALARREGGIPVAVALGKVCTPRSSCTPAPDNTSPSQRHPHAHRNLLGVCGGVCLRFLSCGQVYFL